jgi:fatty acid/phospholipid biosynthesis enzyme
LNGHVMKAHGSASEWAIMNAIRISTEAVQHQISAMIRDEIALANERVAALRPAQAVSAA